MCGIVGWLASSDFHSKWKSSTQTFIDFQQHRGPDSNGHYLDDVNGLFLGHNRLSIIELSELGNQPMRCAQGNVLAFNGEIYNYLELREELILLGHVFNSNSDTEVLLLALQQWGMTCLERLNGMFAFAYWHQASQILHLVRDPMGIKPLYYSNQFHNSAVVFSSELASMRLFEEGTNELDKYTLRQVIEFGHSIDENRTILKNVNKVAPGQRLELQAGAIQKTEYYYTPSKTVIDRAHYIEHEQVLEETLEKVVDQHFVADVPVAMLLSGGLDSSLLAALASKRQQIHTISMGFADSSTDERQYAQEVASYIGSKHTELLISPDDILSSVSEAASHFDDVFTDWGLVSTRLLYQHCHQQGIKVAVVGEGSDELFGGYSTFRFAQQESSSEWNIFRLYRKYAGRRYGRQYFAFRKLMKGYLKTCGNDLFCALRMFETRNRLPNYYLQKVDKSSMSASVEARTPFLDVRVAELAYQTPSKLLINVQDEKLILKQLARKNGLLPESILQRKKFGAGIANDWILSSKTMREFARDTILNPQGLSHQLGYTPAMRRFFDHGQSGYPAPHAVSLFANLAWRLLILNLWADSTFSSKFSRNRFTIF